MELHIQYTDEIGYNAMNEFCVVINEEYKIMINSEELIGTTEYLTL